MSIENKNYPRLNELFTRLQRAHMYYKVAYEQSNNEARKAIYQKAEPVIDELEQLAPEFDMDQDSMRTFCDLLIIFGGEFIESEWKYQKAEQKQQELSI